MVTVIYLWYNGMFDSIPKRNTFFKVSPKDHQYEKLEP